MHWKVKAHMLATLSRVPGGRRLYHTLQSWLGTYRLDADEELSRSLEMVAMIRAAGRDIEDAVVLEIGTGWRPFLPLLLGLLAAKRVITIDVNPWLNHKYAFEAYHALGERLGTIAKQVPADPAVLAARYEATRVEATDLAGLLRAFRVEYVYPADARATGLPDRSIDFVCSSNVLEHVPPDVLREIHRESLRVLRPGGLAVHRFDTSDHFSRVDRSISSVNFLRYSPKQWWWYGGSGLAYQNRLRGVQQHRLLEEAGFTVVGYTVRSDQDALCAVQGGKVPVHQDFARFTPEELTGIYVWLTAMAPAEIRRDQVAEPAIQAAVEPADTRVR